jgi:pyrroloquinoline quinone biosynthesis protein B
LRIVVLGSAAGGGYPQWNCTCAVCSRAWGGDPAARPRTQSSIAISSDGDNWFLMNASPDLRAQIMAQQVLHPRGPGRHSPIKGVLLTNGDVDHLAGLLSLRERQPFVLYATDGIASIVAANDLFGVLADDVVAHRRIALDHTFVLAGPDGTEGPAVAAFGVPGKMPLYRETEAPEIGVVGEDTIGLEIVSGGKRCYYIPACAAFPDWLAARVDGADVVLFDGTLWSDDEMITSGTGQKTGRRMGHMSVSGPDGTVAAFAALAVGRKILIHVNNTNPILLDDSAERAAVRAAGWEVAHDGLEIVL